jgi:hypothetical protein
MGCYEWGHGVRGDCPAACVACAACAASAPVPPVRVRACKQGPPSCGGSACGLRPGRLYLRLNQPPLQRRCRGPRPWTHQRRRAAWRREGARVPRVRGWAWGVGEGGGRMTAEGAPTARCPHAAQRLWLMPRTSCLVPRACGLWLAWWWHAVGVCRLWTGCLPLKGCLPIILYSCGLWPACGAGASSSSADVRAAAGGRDARRGGRRPAPEEGDEEVRYIYR